MSANKGVDRMLTNRQLSILQIIIDDFISTASPVGSRSLSKNTAIPYSSATIRNEMADLEELGFIEKTHTSSGRVPSEKGYRYYVDHLVAPAILQQEEVLQLKSVFEEKLFEIEKVVERSATILSEMTNYTAIVLGPAAHENQLRRIQILPLDKHAAVAVIVTNTGHIENKMIHLPEGFDANEIEKVVNILNERLQGVPLTQIHTRLRQEIGNIFKQHVRNYEQVLSVLENDLRVPTAREKMFYGGKTNLLSQPDFNDIEKVKMLLEVIEEEKMYNLISHKSAGINVKIGKENADLALTDCSIISATYSIGENTLGTIAVLGPTRMEYSRVIGLLSYFSDQLSEALTGLVQEKKE